MTTCEICQGERDDNLSVWLEHGEAGRPGRPVVRLCRACVGAIIHRVADATPTLRKKLDALASQVVGLAAMGKRLSAVEAKIEKCLDSVAEFGVMVVAINENQRAQQREIDRLSDAGETANSEPPAGKRKST